MQPKGATLKSVRCRWCAEARATAIASSMPKTNGGRRSN